LIVACSVVLRNYMAQLAIDRAEKGDYELVQQVFSLLQKPFDDWPPSHDHAARELLLILTLSAW